MSVSPSSNSSGNVPTEQWQAFARYVAPPFAASMAIVPAIYGFIAKSALQRGECVPRMPLRSCLLEGFKASPTVGAIVGTQIIAQRLLEERLHGNKQNGKNKPDFSSMLFSTAAIGTVSAPLLAVFNGQTMGWSPLKSLRMLSMRQNGAIVSRETGFLFGLRLSDPMAGAMRREFGESKVVDYAAAFFSGGMGSLVGHPADTMLTLWQRGEKLQRWSHLMRGAAYKSVAVGIFAICYRAASQAMEPEKQE